MVRLSKVIHRDHLLLAGLVGVIVAFFSLTTFAARAYRGKQQQFGARWYERGRAALRQNRASDAVADFRNALAYSRDDDDYRLKLAEALMADHRPQEARSYLLSLWEKEPGDGRINLELARLAAMWGDTPQAVRYYHASIYGIWDEPTAEHRWQIRFELSEYLLQRNTPQDVKAAQAELVALAGVLPPQDADRQMHLGTLFVKAGLYPRALTAFQTVLADKPNFMPSLEAASEVAFRSADYTTARNYLLPIVAQKPKDEHFLELLNLSELVIRLDPSQRGLPAQEQARRALQDFEIALGRAQKCTPTDSEVATLLDQARTLRPTRKNLASDPGALGKTMDLVFKLESASTSCGPPSLEDKALGLLTQEQEVPR